jgi:toxin ParE1/3/4
MVHRLAEEAEADLDEIWWYIAREGGSVDVAQGVISSLTERFYLLASHPRVGRARDDDLGPGRRSFPVDRHIIVYTIAGDDVLILRVAHSSQDLKALMGR